MDHDRAAHAYLSAPAGGSFWTWDDDFTAVIWCGGSTIAFREELDVVLRKLLPNGLPPLDSVLLMIAAMRGPWPTDSLPLQLLLRATDENQSAEHPFWSNLLAGLDTVYQLPEEVTRSPESKAEIATMVFESAVGVVSTEVGEIVCDILSRRRFWSSSDLFLKRTTAARLATRTHDLHPLRRGLQGLTRESLLLRKRTGLDTTPTAAPVDFVVDQPAIRSLLQQLVRDEALGGLSRLASHVAAVVQLPRSILDSDELPLGGISDLTNRGSLDRLLLSELAHDDLMLATRVALNEALYLRREVQPSSPVERRHVLIDSGIRMWGVPRVFAAAVAMSLAITGGKQASLSAYRASAADLLPVDLSTRDGLIAHLGALEPDAHPGKALPEFFHRIAQSGLSGDAVLVTTEAVLEDPDFQRELTRALPSRFYVACVNRHGGLELWSYGKRGRKVHLSLKLDLEQVVKSPAFQHRKLINSEVDPNLPAIFRVRPFPLRLPCFDRRDLSKEVMWSFPIFKGVNQDVLKLDEQFDDDATQEIPVYHPTPVNLEYGIVVLTRDHRLLVMSDRERGSTQVADNLPFGRCISSWMSDDNRQTFALIYQELKAVLYLFTVDLAEGHAISTTLPSKHLATAGVKAGLRGATFHGGVVFVIFRTMIEAFDAVTGELLDSTYSELPAHWKSGRYFWNPALGHSDAWFAMSFDGSSIVFQHVALGKFAQQRQVCLFDRLGHDGAFGINLIGDIFNVTDQTERKEIKGSNADLTMVEASADGRRILVHNASSPSFGRGIGKQLTAIETESGQTFLVANGSRLAEIDAYRLVSYRQTMRRFICVCVQNEQLVLISKGQNLWSLVVRHNRVVLEQSTRSQSIRLWQNFEATKQSNPSYSLRTAKWDDGSRAWIDARGILHLQSSDRSIPEISFVLVPEEIAVWTSDGRTHGSKYFLNHTNSISAADVVKTILEPFVACLR